MAPPMDQLTVGKCIDSLHIEHQVITCRHVSLIEGFDMQFGTNVLGHALLTLGLLGQLEAGAKTSSDGKARVVNVSSSGAYVPPPGGINFDTLKDGPVRRKLGAQTLYVQSKYVRHMSHHYGDMD